MSATIETTVYQYDELSERAQERARDWYREATCEGTDWAEFVIDDANTIASILGIDIATRTVKLYGGGTRQEPVIYWALHNQGSGVCFDASYSYAKGSVKAIREHAPQDKELHAIADALFAVQRRHFYGIHASVSANDRGMWCEVRTDDYGAEVDNAVEGCINDFRYWIYKQLNAEYNYQVSDEAVIESIGANEYAFTEDGARF